LFAETLETNEWKSVVVAEEDHKTWAVAEQDLERLLSSGTSEDSQSNNVARFWWDEYIMCRCLDMSVRAIPAYER